MFKRRSFKSSRRKRSFAKTGRRKSTRRGRIKKYGSSRGGIRL